MKMEKTIKAYTGADAVGEAMRQINPDVVAAYPITPQTEIMHQFAKYVADGDVDTELVCVESEHSAMSACVGACASGARTMTATAACGLALMWEILYIASANRLPIVMNVVNRALSSPINIHNDHSDSMGARDTGWIQIYSETGQEAYENTIMAMKIAEHPEVLLPVMVCQDGFITSHATEAVELLDDNTVRNFIGNRKGHHSLLDIKNPVTSGALDLYDYYFEHKRQEIEALEKSKRIIKEVFDEFSRITGKKYDYVETYKLEDAELAVVVMSSSAGTIKEAIDKLRLQGKKVGLLKPVVFRPFVQDAYTEPLKNCKVIAVLDKCASFGAFGGPLFNELRSAFYHREERPTIINYIFGLGGREFDMEQAYKVFNELEDIKKNCTLDMIRFLGVRNG